MTLSFFYHSFLLTIFKQESCDHSFRQNHYESIEEYSSSSTLVDLSDSNENKDGTSSKGFEEHPKLMPNITDQLLDEKFQRFQQRLMKPSRFPSNTHHVNINYAEVKELFHPPEHLLPMIPEESSIEVECLAAAALPSVEGNLPEDIAVVAKTPMLPLKFVTTYRIPAKTTEFPQPHKPILRERQVDKIFFQTPLASTVKEALNHQVKTQFDSPMLASVTDP